MVERYNKNITSNDSISSADSQPAELICWIRSLQQALTVEVEHGFSNIQGRTAKFSSFVSDYLLTYPSSSLPAHEISKLKKLALNYEEYPSMSTDLRRRVIVQTRQSLHNLYQYQEVDDRKNSFNLKIRKSNSFNLSNNSSLSKSLSLESSISTIKGVGPKQAERLSGLGLFLIKDLINYFPRDYVDYTELKTIEKTQVGQNVTIVAKIRR